MGEPGASPFLSEDCAMRLHTTPEEKEAVKERKKAADSERSKFNTRLNSLYRVTPEDLGACHEDRLRELRLLGKRREFTCGQYSKCQE